MNTIEVILAVKNPDSKSWEGMGRRQFAVLPRVGEYIELVVEEDETAYLYKVIAVQHPDSPAGTVGEILAVQVGATSEVRRKLFEEDSS